jgi:MFS family permease
MLYPVLPLFLTTALGAPPLAIGIIEGLAEGTASLLKGVSGRLADVYARRPLVAAGYGLSSIAKGLLAFATGWPFVLACRVLDRAGKGVRTSPRDALIASDTPPALRGRAFGFHRAFDTAGAVVGPLLGLALYEALHHEMRRLFLFAVIPASMSVLLVAFVRERAVGKTPKTASASPERVRFSSAYRRAAIFLGLFGLVNFSDAFIILRVKQLGLGFAAVMLAYTLYNASYALLSYPAGIVSDRLPRSSVFGVGLLLFAFAYLGFGRADAAWQAWLLLPIYGAYAALTDGVGKAWIAGLLSAENMGGGLGLYQGITGGASLLAGIWAGLAWGSGGATPFLISGWVTCILAIVLLTQRRRFELSPDAGTIS